MVALLDALAEAAGSTRSGSAPRPRRRRTCGSISKPASRKTASIALFSGSTTARNRSMPASAARGASCSRRRVAAPRPCSSSATVKAISAAERSRRRAHSASATICSPPPSSANGADEGAALAPVGIEEVRDEGRVDAPACRGNAGSGCGRTAARRTRAGRPRRSRAGARSRSVEPSRRMTSTASAALRGSDAHRRAPLSACCELWLDRLGHEHDLQRVRFAASANMS